MNINSLKSMKFHFENKNLAQKIFMQNFENQRKI